MGLGKMVVLADFVGGAQGEIVKEIGLTVVGSRDSGIEGSILTRALPRRLRGSREASLASAKNSRKTSSSDSRIGRNLFSGPRCPSRLIRGPLQRFQTPLTALHHLEN